MRAERTIQAALEATYSAVTATSYTVAARAGRESQGRSSAAARGGRGMGV